MTNPHRYGCYDLCSQLCYNSNIIAAKQTRCKGLSWDLRSSRGACPERVYRIHRSVLFLLTFYGYTGATNCNRLSMKQILSNKCVPLIFRWIKLTVQAIKEGRRDSNAYVQPHKLMDDRRLGPTGLARGGLTNGANRAGT